MFLLPSSGYFDAYTKYLNTAVSSLSLDHICTISRFKATSGIICYFSFLQTLIFAQTSQYTPCMNSLAISEAACWLSESLQLPFFKYSADKSFYFETQSLPHQLTETHLNVSLVPWSLFRDRHWTSLTSDCLSSFHQMSYFTTARHPVQENSYQICLMQLDVDYISFSVSVTRLWLVKCWWITPVHSCIHIKCRRNRHIVYYCADKSSDWRLNVICCYQEVLYNKLYNGRTLPKPESEV